MTLRASATTPADFSSFGAALRHLRRRARLRLRDLSGTLGCSPSYLSRLEQDQRAPDVELVRLRLLPALALGEHSEWGARLLELAEAPRVAEIGDASKRRPGRRRAHEPMLAAPRLLDTKSYVPRPREPMLARSRLLARLDQARTVPLTLVVAPPGSGKTTLLAAWVARRGGAPNQLTYAWLTLDAADNDPALFVRYLVGALQVAAPACGRVTLALLDGPPLALETLLIPLINELAAQAGTCVLILDDYHVIANPQIHAGMTFLIQHTPPALHLILASRAEPPLPLAQLRARDQLIELRAAELLLTRAESIAFLRDAMGLRLADADMAALAARAEGWAAGLQLAALALRDRADPAEYIAAFRGSHRYIADYLIAEVLDHLPAQLYSFLLHTSILDRLCASLCDAVLRREAGGLGPVDDNPRSSLQPPASSFSSYSQQILEQLEHLNLFVVPLDGERRWYRYNQLFGDLLRDQLLRSAGAAEVAELHRRAGAWLDQAGEVDDALGHALAAGAPEHAAAMVERRAPRLIERGELVPLRRWLARLPPELAHERPALALLRAIVAIALGQLDEAAQLIEVAEASQAGAPPQQEALSWLGQLPETLVIARISLARARGQAQQVRGLANAALGGPLEHLPFLRAWALWELSAAELGAGDTAAAEQLLARLVETISPAHDGLWVQATLSLGRIELRQGRLQAVARRYARAIRKLETQPVPITRSVGLLQIGLAAVCYEQNDLEQAGRHADAGLAIGWEPPSALLIALGHAVRAQIEHARGRAAEARAALTQAQAVLPALDAPFFTDILLDAGYARACLALGDLPAAERMLQVASGGPEQQAARAHCLLAAGALAQAEALLDMGLPAAAGQATGAAVEGSILRALARQAAGDTAGAHAALDRAIALAEPAGYLRRFVDAGAPLATLLAQTVARRPQNDRLRAYAAKLLAAFHERLEAGGWRLRATVRTSSLQPPDSALAEPLTEREQQVLHLLAAGAPNRDIAQALIIAPGTVKRHLHSIFGKLGVTSRTQAIARARDLGLL